MHSLTSWVPYRVRFILKKLSFSLGTRLRPFNRTAPFALALSFSLVLFTLHSGLPRFPSQHRTHWSSLSHVDGIHILSHAFASNIIVSEIDHFIFCPVPKAANSNWKYLIRKFEGLHDYYDLTKAHDHNVSGLRYLSDYSPLEIEHLLSDQTFFKFLFVRNPFRRLASCYMDKFLNNNSTYLHAEYRSFLAQLFSWRYVREINDVYQHPRPSFQSFVDELTKQQSHLMNPHWMPQVIHCGLGMIPYDFIGKMEHLGQDVDYVLNVIGKSNERFPTQDEIGFPSSGATRKAISAMYSPDVMAKVRMLYDMDFELLGYNKCQKTTDLFACISE